MKLSKTYKMFTELELCFRAQYPTCDYSEILHQIADAYSIIGEEYDREPKGYFYVYFNKEHKI